MIYQLHGHSWAQMTAHCADHAQELTRDSGFRIARMRYVTGAGFNRNCLRRWKRSLALLAHGMSSSSRSSSLSWSRSFSGSGGFRDVQRRIVPRSEALGENGLNNCKIAPNRCRSHTAFVDNKTLIATRDTNGRVIAAGFCRHRRDASIVAQMAQQQTSCSRLALMPVSRLPGQQEGLSPTFVEGLGTNPRRSHPMAEIPDEPALGPD